MNTKPKAKRILIYGDSITWGYIPNSKPIERYSVTERFPGILQDLLGKDFEVIEEGMHGRTTDLDDPKKDIEPHRKGRNGIKTLFPLLQTHQPLDVIIVQLGKNDLKGRYKKNCRRYG